MRQVLSEVFSSSNLVAHGSEADRSEKKSFPRLDESIHALGAEINFARNLEIFGEGEFPHFVYKVIAGAVRAYKVLNDGRRQILEFYYPGDIFGFDGGLRYAFSAEAVTGSSLYVVKRNLLISSAGHQAELANELWQLMTSDLERARNLSIVLGCKSAQEKVLDFLLEIASHTEGSWIAYLPMSRADVADYLGLTIETVSRTLAQLEINADIKLLSARLILVQKGAPASNTRLRYPKTQECERHL